MAKRSNLIVVLGAAVFVVGACAAWLVLRDSGNSSASNGAAVLYAAKPIPAGTTGEVAVNSGLVKSHTVDLRSKPASALTDPTQLVGRTAQVNITSGQAILAEQFQVAQTVSGAVTIPAGKEALAVQLTNVPGAASFAGAGDRIDVFAVIRDRDHAPAYVQSAKRVMTGIEVLKVNGTTLVPNQGQPGGPGLVYLLAVTPDQAEHLVYLTTFEQLYFALVPKDKAPTAPTPGVDARSILAPVAG